MRPILIHKLLQLQMSSSHGEWHQINKFKHHSFFEKSYWQDGDYLATEVLMLWVERKPLFSSTLCGYFFTSACHKWRKTELWQEMCLDCTEESIELTLMACSGYTVCVMVRDQMAHKDILGTQHYICKIAATFSCGVKSLHLALHLMAYK